MKTYAIVLLCLLFAGCAPSAKRTRTIVTGRIEPRHFQFYTVVKQRDNKAGGWRAACVHLNIHRKNTGESFVCTFGVEVPMQNKDMPISVPLAQRIAAERTDETARLVFGAATPSRRRFTPGCKHPLAVRAWKPYAEKKRYPFNSANSPLEAMTPPLEQLLSIARAYWRPDKDYQLHQQKSPEDERREARWRQALEKIDRWHAFLDDVERALPGFTIGDGTATPDACFRCVTYPG